MTTTLVRVVGDIVMALKELEASALKLGLLPLHTDRLVGSA